MHRDAYFSNVYSKKKGSGSKTPSASPVADRDTRVQGRKPLFGSKPAPAASGCRSLFDAPTEMAEVDAPAGPSGDK
jgi:hypothetical protein